MDRENERKEEQKKQRNAVARDKLAKQKREEKLLAALRPKLEVTCVRLEKHLSRMMADSNIR